MKGSVVWLTFLVLSLPIPARAEIPSEAAYELIVARLLADEGRGREAAEAFASAIELAPNDPYLRLEYCRFLVRQRRLPKAVEQVSIAYQLAPDEPDVLRLYAETKLKTADQDPTALASARESLEKLRRLKPDDIESMVSLGQIYLSEQNPQEAAEVFQEVLGRSSGNRMVYRLLVDALMRSGQMQRAEETLQEALNLDPQFTRARVVLSEILGQQGRYHEAIEVLSAAPPSDLVDPELQKRLALELHRVGDYEGSLKAIDRVLEEEPGDYAALYLKAVVLSSQGDNQVATQLARRLVALYPDRLDVVVLLADLLERQGSWQEADVELGRIEKSLQISRDSQGVQQVLSHRAILLSRAEAWQQLAEVLEPHLPELEDAGQMDLIFLYAEACAHLEEPGKALAILSRFGMESPAGRAAMAKQAEILYRLGDASEAERQIEELVSSDEFDDQMLAAEVYQRLEMYDEAIPVLERSLALNSESTQAMFWLGASYERTGRVSDAESVLEDLLRLDPEFAPALNYLGYMWAEKGKNLDQALVLVQQAVAIEPNNGAYIDSLGWAHFQLGQYEEARSYLERAAKLVGDDPVVFEHLGDLYRALGRLDEARESYRRALALEAGDASQVRQKLDQLDGGQ